MKQSEQGTTKDQVSLDDLKRAIALASAVPAENDDDLRWRHYYWQRSEAWRTAFEWRESLLDRALQGLVSEVSLARWHDERDEGVRLIREKLR